jgi:hypothetical protein
MKAQMTAKLGSLVQLSSDDVTAGAPSLLTRAILMNLSVFFAQIDA